MTTVKNILAVIGALCVLATAGVALLSVIALRTEQCRLRGTRDERAVRPAEQVAKSPSMWSDFYLDHDLHEVLKTPKEWRQ